MIDRSVALALLATPIMNMNVKKNLNGHGRCGRCGSYGPVFSRRYGVIADLFRRADVPGGTHPLADMFRQNNSASIFIPAGTSTRPRKVPARVNVPPAHLPSL